jgi:putative MFS transporter
MSLLQAFARAFRRIYIRPPEPIPPEHRRLLLLVGVGSFFSNYDLNVYGFAMPQIQAGLFIAEDEISTLNAIFRMGVIPALGLTYLADLIGRRTLLLITLAGAILATLATGFSQTVEQFLIAQTLARVCIYTEEMLSIVIIAEEFSERTRGWGIGALAALGAIGAGSASIVFAFVNYLPYGWRALYVVGAFPLVWLLWARRRLPETKRFERSIARGSPWTPFVELLSAYPGRLALTIAATVPFSFGIANAVIFFSKVLQSTHAWTPGQVATLTVLAGSIAIMGTLLAGALSDRYGRRFVLSLMIGVCIVSFFLFYAWASGPWLVLFWITGIFSYLAIDALVSALTAEMFPTSHRSVASGLRLLCGIVAGSIALVLEGTLYAQFESHPAAIALLILPAPLAIIPIWFLPEPARRSLEDVSAERHG